MITLGNLSSNRRQNRQPERVDVHPDQGFRYHLELREVPHRQKGWLFSILKALSNDLRFVSNYSLDRCCAFTYFRIEISRLG